MKSIVPFAVFMAAAFWLAPLLKEAPVLAQAGSQGAAVSACKPDQFSLGTDDENGNFDGMSHSGTLLVLRNLGPDACRMATTPQIKFYNKSGVLNVKVTLLSAGPAKATSVIAAAEAELTSSLRWVSGDVYDPGVCVQANSLHVTVAGKELATELDNQICGQKGKPLEVEMSPLATDPVYRPGKPSGSAS